MSPIPMMVQTSVGMARDAQQKMATLAATNPAMYATVLASRQAAAAARAKQEQAASINKYLAIGGIVLIGWFLLSGRREDRR